MSIYNSVLFPFYINQDNLWSETDFLWNGKEWIVCHDFFQMNNKNIKAKTLLNYLNKIYKNQWYLILDIKWDSIYNYQHNEQLALKQLSYLLIPMIHRNIWLQFSYLSQIYIAQQDPILSKYHIGYLLHQMTTIPQYIHFVNIDLNNVTKDDIIKLKNNHPNLKIIGFTCKKKSNLKFYKHLFSLLYGLVCD
jgi:hypothetical protein